MAAFHSTTPERLNPISDKRGSPKDIEFSLTEDEIKKIQYLGKLERRKPKSRSSRDHKRSVFSENMSLEGQIAMQLAFRDTQAMKTKGSDVIDKNTGTSSPNRSKIVTFADEPIPRPGTTCSRYSTYSEAYEKRGTLKMTYDLTDESFEQMKIKKRSLDGTKIQNTLEMVELVNREDPNCPDDDFIEQIAQRNAVEKCLIWMEVQEHSAEVDDDPKQNITTVPGEIVME